MASLKRLPVTVVSLLFTLFSLSILKKLPHVSAAVPALKTPCAEIGQALLQGNTTAVPVQLAYNCLSSVRLHVAEAKELHRSLRPYLKWQTTCYEPSTVFMMAIHATLWMWLERYSALVGR